MPEEIITNYLFLREGYASSVVGINPGGEGGDVTVLYQDWDGCCDEVVTGL